MKRKISIIIALLLIIGQAVMAQKANYNKLSGLLISKLNHYESKSMHTLEPRCRINRMNFSCLSSRPIQKKH